MNLYKRPFFNAFGNAKLAAGILLFMLMLETLIIIVLAIALARAPSHLDVWQANCDGTHTIIDPNEVSTNRLLNFASMEWSRINTWPTNGPKDIPRLIQSEANNLTPKLINQFKQSLRGLSNVGYFDNYAVITYPMLTAISNNVHKIDGGWSVRQVFVSRFYYNPDDSLKKQSYSNQNALAEYSIEQDITFFVVQSPNSQGLSLDSIILSKDYKGDSSNEK
jgi:hypothetical protein